MRQAAVCYATDCLEGVSANEVAIVALVLAALVLAIVALDSWRNK